MVGKNGDLEEQATGEILSLARVCAYGSHAAWGKSRTQGRGCTGTRTEVCGLAALVAPCPLPLFLCTDVIVRRVACDVMIQQVTTSAFPPPPDAVMGAYGEWLRVSALCLG